MKMSKLKGTKIQAMGLYGTFGTPNFTYNTITITNPSYIYNQPTTVNPNPNYNYPIVIIDPVPNSAYPPQRTIRDVIDEQSYAGGWICEDCEHHKGGCKCKMNMFISFVGCYTKGCCAFKDKRGIQYTKDSN